ncbi:MULTISPECIES: LLM class F420-dependent oxidoreductase [Protofrankia]|uniref:F420-dependent oxidoreductase n=1 Tax=Protofrankia coriariae TaxID=1562887 RepID=A0ABR5F6W9_9ACTN|nr:MULTISPECIES: LLM class F420-dependent oxidoreductase [Protofrankia]KLL12420.1 F420-dependent oxidoreductase [Protofrankia coriariae]ONH32058.1 LLM class F420-dependent oxidoreductase [Protofrankia sp. BMG5.30]
MTTTPTGVGIWNMGLRFGGEEQAVEAAVAAEELGYTAVWLPDLGGGGLFERLTALLAATSRITVATGILNIWMHEPATVAERYAKLTGTYGDRLLIGLGVSHAPIVDQAAAGRYRRPLARMTEFLDGLDAASPAVPAHSRVLAALGPRMLRLAGERAHGAHPYLVPLEHVATARAALGPEKFLAPELAVVLETDPDRARQIARTGLGMYFDLPNYMNNLRRYGFTDDDLAAPGSDRLIDALVAWGDEETIAARVAAYRDAGADHVAVQVLIGEHTAAATFPIEQWRRLAPVLTG